MDPRISIITLAVADLKTSIDFYESLGLSRHPPASSQEGESIAFFQMAGMVMALYPRDKLAEDAAIPAMAGGFSGVTLAYNTRDREEADAICNLAIACGAELIKKPEPVFWGGYSGYFADPDGHLWEVAHNPFFPLDEKGRLHLPTPE